MGPYLYYAFAAVCILAPLLIALWLIRDQLKRQRKERLILQQWRRTSARVTRVEQQEDDDHDLTAVYISYAVPERGEIEESYTYLPGPEPNTGPRPGDQMEILVNPEDPEEFLKQEDLTSSAAGRSCYGCVITAFLALAIAMAIAFFKLIR